MGSRIDLRLLGPIELWVDGTQLDVGYPRQRGVLAVLALDANRVVAIDQLVDRVWGLDPPERVRAVLYGYVARLRAVLRGRDGIAVTHRSGGYSLQVDSDNIDLNRFRRLVATGRDGATAERSAALFAEALGLWRGGALADVRSPWLDAVRERLEQDRLAAVIERNDLELGSGRHTELLGELRSYVDAHPYDERLVGQLMVAAWRSGRRSEALECYRILARRLASDLGVDPGEELRDLHVEILADRPLSTRVAPVTGVPPRSGGVPAQLPHDVPGFVGRVRELAMLFASLPADAAEPGETMVISAIGGVGGVGKTGLAVRFAHQVAARYPDGQLYANLHGFDAFRSPAAPGEVLGQFLRALGTDPPAIPADVEEQAALYRSVTAGRRLLVLLDNAASEDQVRPLLPGTVGSLTVVTSRNRLVGLVARDGARQLALDVLTPDEARSLVEHVAGPERVRREQELAAELCRLCGYLPLALRIVAADLATDPGLRISDVVARLRGDDRLAALGVHGDDQTAVRVAFDMSYRTLDPAARLVFRRLGLVPGTDFTSEAVAALTGLPPDRCRLLIESLVGHLVERAGPGRYRLHDLLRLYAVQQSAADDPPAERTEAVARLLDWYCQGVYAAAAVLYPAIVRLPADDRPAADGRLDRDAAVAWLDAERANLVAAAVRAAHDGPRSAAWRIADAMRGYFFFRRYTADWLTAARAGLRAAEAEHDRRAEAAMRTSIGLVHQSTGQLDQAAQHYREALRYHRAAGWRAGEAATLNNLGLVSYELGRLDEATTSYAAALDINQEAGNERGATLNLGNIGSILAHRGRLREAAEYHAAALDMNRRAGLPDDEAGSLTNLGLTYFQLGYFDRALDRYSAALARYGMASPHGRAVTLDNMAAVHRDSGRLDSALRLADLALTVATDAADHRTRGVVFNTLGGIWLAAGRVDRAAECHLHALRLSRDTGHSVGEIDAHLGLAAVRRAQALAADAGTHGRQALELSERAGNAIARVRALTVLARIDLDRGAVRASAERARHAVAQAHAAGYRLGLARALDTLADVLDAAGAPAAAADRRRAARDLFAAIGAAAPAGRGLSSRAVPS